MAKKRTLTNSTLPAPTKPMRRSPPKKSIEERGAIAKKARRTRSPGAAAKRFERGFGSLERVEFIQSLPCIVCGRGPVEAAHAKSRGAGGGPDDLLPLCGGPDGHHAEQHRIGVRTFEKRHGVNLKASAAVHARLWARLSA